MALGKEQILQEMELKREVVKLETGDIIVSEISAIDYMDTLDSDLIKTNGEFDGVKFTSLLATRMIVDEAGQRIFADEDAETLRTGPKRVYTKICAAVNRLTGLAGDEVKN